MRKLLILTTAVVLALATAACGGDGDDDSGSRPQGSASPTVSESARTPEDGVVAKDLAFAPERRAVKVGATVTWLNADAAPHTVTSGRPGAKSDEFDAPLEPAGTFTRVFDKPGTFPYFCTIHPQMTGEIVVS